MTLPSLKQFNRPLPRNIERVFKAIANLPSLRELRIQYGYYGSDLFEEPVSVERVGWLVAGAANLEVLRIDSVDLHVQEHVVALAEILSKSVSLKRLEMEIVVGYRDVTSVAPLMQSLSGLPHLTELLLKIDAFDNFTETFWYADEAAPILAACVGAKGVVEKTRDPSGVVFTNIRPNPNERRSRNSN